MNEKNPREQILRYYSFSATNHLALVEVMNKFSDINPDHKVHMMEHVEDITHVVVSARLARLNHDELRCWFELRGGDA